MDSAVEPAPQPPQGYVHAGPVSEYRPSAPQAQQAGAQPPHTEATANEHSETEKKTNASISEAESPLAGCPAAAVKASAETPAADCPVNAAHLIKVVEISQPAGRYPPKKRVAVTYFHGKWTFDAVSGQSDSTRFVVDTFDVKEIDGHVFVSEKPRNSHVAGPRRDFGGKELN
ncbi:hypothetical protein BGZ70_001518 [Mortierella alpina]|uniref:Uncharacterized protein n=1 Tax=Mortierella alpina TaxID=64518 RepID=A0A9P6IVQ9_MORAP|nr:hypothetical protein BGZ70_001518 [Mortierella alpina]